MTGSRPQGSGRLRRLLLAVTGMVVAFYGVPVDSEASVGRTVGAVLLTLGGIAALAWAVVDQVRRQMRSRSEDIHTLVLLLPLITIVFALACYVLETHDPGQMSGLSTRTDALYFTLSTLTTVGYGDVHAAGQLARALAILQLVFNGVFVGALVSTVFGTLRSRAPVAGSEVGP